MFSYSAEILICRYIKFRKISYLYRGLLLQLCYCSFNSLPSHLSLYHLIFFAATPLLFHPSLSPFLYFRLRSGNRLHYAHKTEPNYSSSHITHRIPFLFCDILWASKLGGRVPICDQELSCQIFSVLWIVMKSSCFYSSQLLKEGFSERDWKLNKSICINISG